MSDSSNKWKFDGVLVVHGHELDVKTPQTPTCRTRRSTRTTTRRGRASWVVNIHPAPKA